MGKPIQVWEATHQRQRGVVLLGNCKVMGRTIWYKAGIH